MSVATMTEQAAVRAVRKNSGGEAPRQQRAFATAQRHSRNVRRLKVIVPVVAIVMAGAFAVASYVLTPAKVSVATDGSAYVDGKLVMANPKLEGMTKENQPYSLTAVRAIQDLSAQNVIELENIAANFPMSEKQRVAATAPRGIYDRDANTLNLTEPFLLKTGDGMSAQLNSAFLDIAKGVLETADPVEIQLDGSNIKAQSLKVLDKGKLLVFEKNVRVTIEPSRLQKMRSANGEENDG